MKKVYIKGSECKVNKWSGGETKELFIYPPESNYAVRDFLFRVSCAKIETEQSDFTHLKGVNRWLSPLKGSFELTFTETNKCVVLKEKEILHFDGGLAVKCKGKGKDVNLMVRGKVGEMDFYKQGFEKMLTEGYYVLYFEKGGCVKDKEKYEIQAGDAVFYEILGGESLIVSVSSECFFMSVKA